MTDDELDRIAERHFEGLPPRSSKESEMYAGLDFVVWELQMAKKWWRQAGSSDAFREGTAPTQSQGEAEPGY
ncbi:hypothetical protein [Rhodococcus tukisamuensis]|uniref:Uncharacterized protein n=1 Tax=Rhodococcus tukisamuensis TaxID=168276 RepID=A0A1G6MNR6_9NOCA|nr:hypothetical protein [Rhodococcus tukisamuensis]SDC57228.1 hypothetical protein SAMN05444580_101252 [Rhodococcus tukisamuensis]